MGYTAWPSATELGDFVDTTNDFLDADSELNTARNEFERMTGYLPFLTEGTASNMLYTPASTTGYCFALPYGYTEITSVYVGGTSDDDGTLLTAETDYYLMPELGNPYEVIYFKGIRSPGTIRIVGKRGYSTEIPADAWLAVMQRAAYAFAFNAEIAVSTSDGGTVSSLKQGPVTVSYATPEGGFTGEGHKASAYRRNFERVCAKYRRKVVF
jgi:hypothetical protein